MRRTRTCVTWCSADWAERRAAREEARSPAKARPKPAVEAAPKPRKLTYGEKLELEKLPARIEALEGEKHALEASLSDPAFYRGAPGDIAAATARLAELGREVDAAYARWDALSQLPA